MHQRDICLCSECIRRECEGERLEAERLAEQRKYAAALISAIGVTKRAKPRIVRPKE